MSTIEILTQFRAALAAAATPEALAEVRTAYLGKKSYVKTALKSLGGMPAEERPRFAKEINDAAQEIERELDEATARIAEAAVAKQIEAEWQDLTLPGIAHERGSTHPAGTNLAAEHLHIHPASIRGRRSASMIPDSHCDAQ